MGARSKILAALAAASVLPFWACGSRASWTVEDVDGQPRPALGADARATVLIFVAPDCPIANAFVPEMKRIHADYSDRDVAFRLVYPDGDVAIEDIRAHLEAFDHGIPALLDFDHLLVDHTGATVTPEAAVLSPDGEVLYLGRIDDRFVDYGKQRAEPTVHDLRDALDAVLGGRIPPNARTPAVGCFIPDVD